MEAAINEEVRRIATGMKEALTIDNASGIVTAEKGLYEKMLPEAITVDAAKAVHKHDANFVAAGCVAIGEIAVDAMAGNKELKRVTGEIAALGADTAAYTVDREKTYKNSFAKAGEPTMVTKTGVVSTTYTQQVGRDVGQMATARAYIRELATSRLAAK